LPVVLSAAGGEREQGENGEGGEDQSAAIHRTASTGSSSLRDTV
jgi:hypothetical protein